MEYCFLKGFLVVLLIQHCTSEGLSASIQSSSVVTLKGGQALAHEPEEPAVVAPPSLKEVQQAMQEVSEKVEGHGAEKVLKELLEKVVEAAMGQVEGGGEAKRDEVVVQDAVTEDVLGAEKVEADTNAEVLDQAVEDEDMGAKEGDTVVGEKQEVVEMDAFKDVVEEGKGGVEGEKAAESMEEITVDVEAGGRDEVEVINESVDTEVSQEVVEETVTALKEKGGDLTVQEAEVEDNNNQVVLPKEKGAVETETQEAEETPAVVKVALGREAEQESDPSLVVTGVEQIGDVGENEEALVEETQVDEMEGEVVILPSDSYEIETTHTVGGELVQEEEHLVNQAGGPEVEDKQGHIVVEGGGTEEKEAEGTNVGEAAEGERDGKSEINEKLVKEAGEEARVALDTSHGTEMEDQEVLVISAPVPEDGAEASIEHSPEKQAPTLSPSLGGVETGENTLGDKKSNHGNEIITPTNDLLPHDPVMAQPTLDNFVKDEHPQAERGKPGETNELVEDTTGTIETNELGLEAWKIGAISAAVFLVLETVVIIFYILKRRNKSSTPALQRACEEGCVEPEEATGGDCSDDTLPADNGDTEQIAALDPPDVTSTLTHNIEHYEEHAIAMSDLPSSSTGESVNNGPGSDSSQDLRTSIL